MIEQSYTTLEQSQELFKLLEHGHCADMMYTWESEPETGWEGYDEPSVGVMMILITSNLASLIFLAGLSLD